MANTAEGRMPNRLESEQDGSRNRSDSRRPGPTESWTRAVEVGRTRLGWDGGTAPVEHDAPANPSTFQTCDVAPALPSLTGHEDQRVRFDQLTREEGGRWAGQTP